MEIRYWIQRRWVEKIVVIALECFWCCSISFVWAFCDKLTESKANKTKAHVPSCIRPFYHSIMENRRQCIWICFDTFIIHTNLNDEGYKIRVKRQHHRKRFVTKKSNKNVQNPLYYGMQEIRKYFRRYLCVYVCVCMCVYGSGWNRGC